jgi:redox-sensitive bicupin YhaK (pirin superfamily)
MTTTTHTTATGTPTTPAGTAGPVIDIRPAGRRGHTDIGWLDSRHSFSFGDYYDPANMGFRVLRVINDDRIAAGGGFPTHPHRDMEILTWVLSGSLAHEDSLGHAETLRPGDLQFMTAGTGLTHSEYNASDAEPVHLLQIWVLPRRRGLTPAYGQRTFPLAEREGRLRLVASADGRERSVVINQDADLYVATLRPGQEVAHTPRPGRSAWVQVARGSVSLNGRRLAEGDGAAVSPPAGEAGESVGTLTLRAETPAEALLFDLP